MTAPHELLGQDTEFAILENFLSALMPTFVDVGAERGGFSRWLMQRGFRGIAIEPLPKHAAALRDLAANGSLRLLDCAIDVEDGRRQLHIATGETGVPLDHFHSLQPLANDARVHHTQTIEVTCRSLGSLVREGLLPARTGVLKVDTEGNDLRVLQGMAPLEADVLIVEYFTAGIYAGWTDADPVRLIQQAEALGYAHCLAVRRNQWGLEQVSYQPLSFPEKEWGNLVFFRKISYAQLRSQLAARNGVQEQALLEKIGSLQQCCDERLALINYLHAEAEKRLQLLKNPTAPTPVNPPF